MRPIDFNDDVAVNPMLRPVAAIFSARAARVKLRNGERATLRVFQANFLRLQVFIFTVIYINEDIKKHIS